MQFTLFVPSFVTLFVLVQDKKIQKLFRSYIYGAAGGRFLLLSFPRKENVETLATRGLQSSNYMPF